MLAEIPRRLAEERHHVVAALEQVSDALQSLLGKVRSCRRAAGETVTSGSQAVENARKGMLAAWQAHRTAEKMEGPCEEDSWVTEGQLLAAHLELILALRAGSMGFGVKVTLRLSYLPDLIFLCSICSCVDRTDGTV